MKDAANSSARIAASVARGRETDLAGGPGRSAAEGGRRASELGGWLAPPCGVGVAATPGDGRAWGCRGFGPRGEKRGGELGRPGEREREEEADRAGLGSGPRRELGRSGPAGREREELAWAVGLGWGLGFLWVFPFLFLFTLSFQI